MTTWFVVPTGYDDPAHPSGGNTYDRRVIGGLRDLGTPVRVLRVPTHDTGRDLVAALEQVGDTDPVVVDALVLRWTPALAPLLASRRVVVLVHLPLGVESPRAREPERTALAAATEVVTTSPWASAWLRRRYGVGSRPVEPGVDPAPLARGGGGLLSVGALTHAKGHDVLVAALRRVVRDRGGPTPHTTIVGALDLEPGHVDRLRSAAAGLSVELAGPLTGRALATAYDGADLLVLPSRTETYGMVVTEALAHGVPVVASDVGGVAGALGRTPEGHLPGVLVPPGDPEALADALAAWLDDVALRERLRERAVRRRDTLPGWPEVVTRFAGVLNRPGARPV